MLSSTDNQRRRQWNLNPFAIFSTTGSSCLFTPVFSIIQHPVSHLLSLWLCPSAYEWQGHKKPLHPVSLEVDEKRRLQVYDRSGSAHRFLNLGNQDYLDVLLSSNRQHKALLLKVSKEYDLVSSWKWKGWFAPSGCVCVHVNDQILFSYLSSQFKHMQLSHWGSKVVSTLIFHLIQPLLQARFCRFTWSTTRLSSSNPVNLLVLPVRTSRCCFLMTRANVQHLSSICARGWRTSRRRLEWRRWERRNCWRRL